MTKARSNAVANAAKGDLTVGNGTDLSGILAVGSNGDTLVADSSTSTGLRYTGNFAAGKNAILNADFNLNQRSFTSTTTDGTYGFDRWNLFTSGGTCTYSTQAFTPGTAPVAGYEGTNFARLLTTGQTTGYSILVQKIENARTFAGQTVTVSFWAKAGTGTPQVAVNFYRNYGTGGSPSAAEYTNTATKVTLTTSWARYSATLAIPSVSGKTFGTNANSSFIGLYLFTSDNVTAGSNSLGLQNATIDFWGAQVEAGSVATAFQTATGTIQGELAACQRYYQRVTGRYGYVATGTGNNSTDVLFQMALPVQMRIAPTALSVSALGDWKLIPGNKSISAFNLANPKPSIGSFYVTSTGLSANQSWTLFPEGNTNGDNSFIDFTAEL
jgi:hypothetical protein